MADDKAPRLQLPLDLGHRPALGREDFLVAPSNELAVAWIDRWPDWPEPTLALHGPPGAGKTHLLRVWRAASKAAEMHGSALAETEPPALLGQASACALDAADLVAGRPEAERRLFHLYNLIRERGGQLMLAGRSAPVRWPVALPDLRSRLATVPAVALEPPDDALIEAVLIKLFADRQLLVGAEIVSYLVLRMERSFSAARELVAALDAAALAEQRRVTIPLVRQVLQDRGADDIEA